VAQRGIDTLFLVKRFRMEGGGAAAASGDQGTGAPYVQLLGCEKQ
jgi:hypothetical protein